MGRKSKNVRYLKSKRRTMKGIKGKFRENKKKKTFIREEKPREIRKQKFKKIKVDRSKRIGWLKKMREKAKDWKNNECIFCKIIRNEVHSNIVYEDEYSLVVMDIFPTTIGQTLLIVKKHEDYFFNLDGETYAHTMQTARKIIKATDKTFKPIRTCLLVEGFEVPHAHIKLYPCYEEHFSLKLLENKPTEDELKKQAEKIKTNLTDS